MQRILNKDKRAADLLRRRPELLTDSMMVPAFTARSKRVQKRIEELFSSRDNLVSLMEILQREDWRQMRAYLTVLKEYLPVLDADKQDIILDFLYDMLSHQSGMVRRIAARTYGYLLAFRHREYGYDPGRSIHRILFPGTTVSLAERRKINYQLRYVLLGYDELADERSRKHVLNHYAGYFKSSRWDKATCFYLIMGITDIPCDDWSNLQKYHIFSFLRNHIRGDHEEVRLAALYLLDRWLGQGWKISDEIRQYLLESGSQEGSKYCERYLIARIHNAVTGSGSLSEAEPDYEDILTLFQENQHSHALWINKILNLSILKEYFYRVQESGEDERGYGYQYANHLINMLRLNKQAVVFLQAGSDLTEITDIQELSGRKVQGQMGTLYDTIIDDIDGVVHVEAATDFPAAINALQHGDVDAVTSELPVAIGVCAANPDLTYVQFEQGHGFTSAGDEGGVTVSIAVAKENTDLLKDVQAALDQISEADRAAAMEAAVLRQPASEE